MVSMTKIIFMVITALIAFGLPIVLGIVFVKSLGNSKGYISGWPCVFHFSNGFKDSSATGLFKAGLVYCNGKNHLLLAIFLGLTAGIFEEVGRFLGFRFLLKDRLNYGNGLAFGVGHGGIEAVLLVGLNYINYIIFALLLNKGLINQVFAGKISNDMISEIVRMLVSTPAYNFLLAGLERAFAITIQIALSLIVLLAVRNKNLLYLLIAILLHMLIDTPIAYMAMQGVNVFILEGVTFLIALASLYFIIRMKDMDKGTNEVEL
ncbi:YhfC family intramembrane metalloprotease [Caloramator sp. Dgby_cultured_2]|uniref:YhfC family intramembrane metalloprotease n=1 Tax=Caloramator sp. Dgby_cultured_2 TaxID=3029174 RepID=UPI00237D4D82|nr:YhfC family glutamic-type intramembrane protease [Caloramator sp. Dgby_cultured_2]WDU83347.1 YhfC family glutamic-type intramembrane protease [Caloramator sp. Dgby_cultured_2]